ncbi:MAG: DUF1385 domain-containing protein [Solirubrobacteraceae bacterium]
MSGGGGGDSGRPAPPLTAVRDAPLGGQAVLEGVMMRGIGTWAVAVRRPAPEGAEDALGEIVVRSFPLATNPRRRRVYRLPVIRGVVALVHSLSIGVRALGISANEQLAAERDEDEVGSSGAGDGDDGGGDDDESGGGAISGGAWAGTIVVSIAFAVGLFFVVPVTATNLIKHQLGSSLLFWLVEGALRTAIFLGYLWLLSRVRDLRRVFEYHGAEHKVISCFEAGDELTPDRAQLYSRLHPRCGTSFLLVVMIMGIFVFALAGLPSLWLLIVTRIVGIPLIAGLSFEVIKWAGRNRRRRWVQAIMYPGLQLQRLTTREPDLDELAVSIAALEAVLAVETPGAATADELLGLEVVA